MDNEQKYKNALKKVKELLDSAKNQGHIIVRVEDIENAFPELKESEDERIKREILELVSISGNGNQFEEIKDWLEKQGEPEDRESDDNLTWLKTFIEEEAYYLSMDIRDEIDRKKLIKLQNALAWLEKQEKQKPILDFKASDWYVSKVDGKIHNMYYSVDKVEPKFHPGDWVIDNVGYIYQIESATEIESEHIFGYTIVGGGYFNDNNDVRLWSIDDAKCGDVLVDKYNNIGIYKEIGAIYWDSYIYLGCDGVIRGFSIGGRHEQTGTHPATKEQCDLFFAKMKEAGWEWDSENKELIKKTYRIT